MSIRMETAKVEEKGNRKPRPSIGMGPTLKLFSRNVMARHREGAKDRATDGSNKKGVQLNDQGIGQQLGGM